MINTEACCWYSRCFTRQKVLLNCIMKGTRSLCIMCLWY